MQEFKGGKIAVVVSSLPFKCPPAPYEATFLTKEILEKRKVVNKTDLQMYTPEALPLPVAGPVVGEKVRNLLLQSKIGFNPKRKDSPNRQLNLLVRNVATVLPAIVA